MEDRSVLTRAARPADLALAYGTHPDRVADVWFPATPAPAALVLLWHGGFWAAEWDRAHAAPLAEALAAAGFVVGSMEYRRVGAGGGWPATFADVADASDRVPGLIERAAPGRVRGGATVLAGHSAGGHLAMWNALRHRLPPGTVGARRAADPAVTGVLGLAPVLDLAATAARGDPVDALLGGSPTEVPDRYAVADPSRLGPPEVEVALVHGTADSRVPVGSSRAWSSRCGGRLVEIEGADHFAVIDPLAAAYACVVNELRTLTDR